jgi:hypothetical protein
MEKISLTGGISRMREGAEYHTMRTNGPQAYGSGKFQ